MPSNLANQVFHEIVETIREPLLVLDSNLKVLFASQNFIDTFQVTREETVGNFVYDLGNQQWNIPKLRELLNTILSQHTAFKNYEVQHDFSIIGRRTMLLNARQVQRGSGNDPIILLAIEDITNRKRLEDLLKESEERFRRLFETANDGILLLEKDALNIRFANPAITTMLGYSNAECIDKEMEDIGFPHDIGRIQELMQTLESDGIMHYKDAPVKKKTGQVVDTDIYFVDKTNLIQCNVRDITERKRMEQESLESEERYRLITQNSLTGIYIHVGGLLKFVNRRFAEMLGYAPEEIVGRQYWDFVHPEDREMVKSISLARAKGEEAPPEYESRHLRKDGTTLWVHNLPTIIQYQGQTANMGNLAQIDERKQAERILRESEQVMRYIIKYDPNAIAVYDRDLRYIAVSDRYLKDYNVVEKNILGKHHYEIFPEMPQRWKDIHQRVLKGATERNDDDHFKRTDGSTTYNRWECRPWYTANGSIGGIITYTEVTTERKLAEQALIQSKAHLRTLVDSIPDLIWLKDQDGIYLSCNPMFERFFGSKESEIVGKTDYDFVDKDLADFFRANDRIAMKADRPSKNEEELTFAANGYKGLFETIKTPMRDSEGKIVGVLGIARDITERKKSENEIIKQKRLFETMFNAIPDGVIITNTQREILLANKGMDCTFGYKPEDLLGKSTEMLYADRSKYVETGTSVFEKKVANPEHLYVTRYRDKNGREFSGETFGARLFDENNQWIGNLRIMRDITKREQAEMHIQKAQKIESIGNLAGGIAHDFNNLLFPIVGMAELLMEDLAPDSQEHENAEEIYNAGRRGSDLVKQILAFSRQSEHKKIPVRVHQILKEVLKLCRSTIPANIEITQNISSDCGMVMADPTQIHQIAMNLITNAFHAVEPTGAKISVQLKAIEIEGDDVAHSLLQPGQYVMLSVSDTGSGIDPKILDKIFDPYFTTKGQGKGTGLGLAVVQGIVKEHHGDIKVCSEVGIGTTVDVYLPIIEKSSDPLFVEKVESLFLGNERILLVDDEEPIMRLEKQILERLGYQVASRISSVDALEAFKANPDSFDLVITDMTMPNMTGEQFARKLMSIKPDMPVIVLTGFSERINQENAATFGIKGLLMKPIIKSELAKMIRQVLDEAKGKTQQ